MSKSTYTQEEAAEYLKACGWTHRRSDDMWSCSFYILSVQLSDAVELQMARDRTRMEFLVKHLDPPPPVQERPRSFMDRCVAGEVVDPLEEIDNEVDAWHQAVHATQEQTESSSMVQQLLSDHLGMGWLEYRRWVGQPSSLLDIIEERKKGQKQP